MTHPDQRDIDRAKVARALLDVIGLDVGMPGRQRTQGPAEVTVGPSLRGWAVTIDLASFDMVVAPLLRAAIDAKAEKEKA